MNSELEQEIDSQIAKGDWCGFDGNAYTVEDANRLIKQLGGKADIQPHSSGYCVQHYIMLLMMKRMIGQEARDE